MAEGDGMTALYLVAAQYREAAAKLADLDLDSVTLADTLESLSGDLETKAQSVAFMARSMEADAAAVKQWAKDATERAKAIEARAERLREYLSDNMEACGIQRIEGPGITLSFRKSHAVVIDEPGLIPAEYMRTPEPPPAAPDKRAITDAIKLGEVVPGAHVETRQALQIR
jgi:Siphovirus Gp157